MLPVSRVRLDREIGNKPVARKVHSYFAKCGLEAPRRRRAAGGHTRDFARRINSTPQPRTEKFQIHRAVLEQPIKRVQRAFCITVRAVFHFPDYSSPVSLRAIAIMAQVSRSQ